MTLHHTHMTHGFSPTATEPMFLFTFRLLASYASSSPPRGMKMSRGSSLATHSSFFRSTSHSDICALSCTHIQCTLYQSLHWLASTLSSRMHKPPFKLLKSPNLVVLDGIMLIVLLILMRDGNAYETGKYEMARHSSFVRSMYGRYGRRSEAVLSCAHNQSVCGALLEKGTYDTWSTCCWGKVCKDLREDSYHCGECGRSCGYGLSCCNGACVDLNMDSHNCGRCGNFCPYQEGCSFGMCDYAGVTFISPPPPMHGPKHR